MTIIIQILVLFIFLNCVIKLSFWKLWQAALFGLVCALFVVFANQFAVMQSKTTIDGYLNDSKIMQDLAVLVTLESALCLAFCFSALRKLFGKRVSLWVRPLNWYPSLLVFPALFFVLTELIFALPGVSFSATNYAMAAAVLIAMPTLSWAVRKFLPEQELRLELHFLVSLFVAVVGLIATANGNVTYTANQETFNMKALLFSLAVFVLFFVIGSLWYRFKWILRQRKKQETKPIDSAN